MTTLASALAKRTGIKNPGLNAYRDWKFFVVHKPSRPSCPFSCVLIAPDGMAMYSASANFYREESAIDSAKADIDRRTGHAKPLEQHVAAMLEADEARRLDRLAFDLGHLDEAHALAEIRDELDAEENRDPERFQNK